MLTNKPEVIFDRKQELSLEIIGDQLKGYEQEVKRWGENVIVSTDTSIAGVAVQVSQEVLARCSERTSSRLGILP